MDSKLLLLLLLLSAPLLDTVNMKRVTQINSMDENIQNPMDHCLVLKHAHPELYSVRHNSVTTKDLSSLQSNSINILLLIMRKLHVCYIVIWLVFDFSVRY